MIQPNEHINETFNVPTIKEVITSLREHKVDLILVGGEAGQLYNLCESKKDIDFILNNSEENMRNLYNYIFKSFKISYEEFTNLSTIMLITKEKRIDFFKDSEFINFEDANSRVNYFTYYGNSIKTISVEDYISIIKEYTKYIQNEIYSSTDKQKILDKIVRYERLIKDYSYLKSKNKI